MDTMYIYVTRKMGRVHPRCIIGGDFPYQIRPIDNRYTIVYIIRDNCDRNLIIKTLISRFINRDKYIQMDDGTIWFVQAHSRISEKVKDQGTIDNVHLEIGKLATMV